MIWLDSHIRCWPWRIAVRRRAGWRGLQLLILTGFSVLCLPVRSAEPARDATPAVTSQASPTLSATVLDPTYRLGSWIWTTNTYNKQSCRLWKSFEIPAQATVQHALLRVTGDNGYRLMLDGRQVGQGSD